MAGTLRTRLTEVVSRIDEGDVRPLFQPIVNIFTGSVVGYEVLSRATEGGDGFEALLEKARKHNITWELERACRLAALRRISNLPPEKKNARYFLNVSPEIFGDNRFAETFNPRALAEFGLDQSNIVLELTEKESIVDYAKFEQLIQFYSGRGFTIALDDFGSGHSGLVTLISSRPHFLKLDMSIARDVHLQPYKQSLVRSLVSLASSVGAALIAEGVETWDELEMLVRLGVRYGQGFLFGRPMELPDDLSADFRKQLAGLARQNSDTASNLDETVRRLVIRCDTLKAGSRTTEELVTIFRRSPSLDHVVILDGKQPVGLVTRDHLFQLTGWRYGYSLFERKPVDLVSKRSTLTVKFDMPITTLARLAMDRLRDDLYDPIIVVNEQEEFAGSVTMKQLLSRSVELELKSAHDANPLTELPGNRTIQRWLLESVERPQYCVVYADLDHFKEYNDAYGFVMGDEVIKLAAKVIAEALPGFGSDARLGHVGGDDFVVVSPRQAEHAALEEICHRFDHLRLEHFNSVDRERGWYESVDRAGNHVRVPLLTLSLAVIQSDRLDKKPHPALLAQIAASLKKKAKAETKMRGKSCFVFEQRVHAAGPSAL